MEFKNYLIEQAKKHPSMQPSDIAKMCYQAALGAEHLLLDVERARAYFNMEFDSVEPREGDLFECLSDNVCRIDLGVWKKQGRQADELFDMFVATASIPCVGKEHLLQYLSDVQKHFSEFSFSFSLDEWQCFLEKYKAAGMPAVHHSNEYRESERPAYRIVLRSLLNNI